ncbi:hypothetical protein ACWGF3_14860 [Streptomyces xanthophaeus]
MKKILATTALALAGIALAGPAQAADAPDPKAALRTTGESVVSMSPSPAKEVFRMTLDAAQGAAG